LPYALHLSHLVCLIHEAPLTEKMLLASHQKRTRRAIVVSDRANRLDDGKIKLLCLRNQIAEGV